MNYLIMNNYPLVSILCASYNHEKYVIQALESFNQQTYMNIELILIDDCSKDNSVELIENWLFKNFKYKYQFIKHTRNKGISKTCNELLALAKGEYISFFATDDVMMPDKIKIQVEVLEKFGQNYAVCYGDTRQIDEFGNIMKQSLFVDWLGKDFVPPNGKIIKNIIDLYFFYIQSTTIRRSALKNFYFNKKYISEDWYLLLSVLSEYEAVGITDIVCNYRIVKTSVTQQNWFGKNIHKVIRSQLNMFLALYPKLKGEENYLNKIFELFKIYIKNKDANTLIKIYFFFRIMFKYPLFILKKFYKHKIL